MRSVFILFFAIAAFLSGSVFAQTSVQTKAPDLPDFNKEPYFLYRYAAEIHSLVSDDQEPRAPEGRLYADNKEEPSKGSNFIMLFVYQDGSIVYAEWMQLNEDRTGSIVRSYNLKDGKWVFDKEASWPR